MFENYENRQRAQTNWYRPIGVMCTLFSLGVMAWRCNLDSASRAPSYFTASPDYAPPPVELHWQRLELPGMSIEAPMFAISTGTYMEGKVEASGLNEFAITWQAGEMSDEEERAKITRAVVDNASHRFEARGGTREVMVAGTRAYQISFAVGDGVGTAPVMTMTFAACGGRSMQILVGGPTVIDSSSRMIKSFRCTPDPKQDVRRRPVVVDVRDGWHRTADDDLVLANASNVRVISLDLGVEEDGTVADKVIKMMATTNYRLREPAKTRGEKVFWTGVLHHDGKTIPVAVLAWRCEDRRIAVIVVSSPGGAPLAPGIVLADTGRCLTADEPMPPYPPA